MYSEEELLEARRKEQERIQRIDEFLFKPPITGGLNRAQRLDELLTAATTGKNMARVTLWIAGFLIAISSAYGVIRGWTK